MKIRKGVLCLLLAFLCLLPVGTAWATETEPSASAATADDPYIKDAADDSSEADDLQWYRDNSAVLENRSIIRDALRSIGWGVTKLVCKLANVAETLYTKTFGMIDITNYPQINKLLETLKPVLAALTVLCCAGLGIMLLMQQEKHPPLLRNILLGIVAVSASAYLFSTANDLVISFRDGILGSDEQKNQSYTLVNSNLIDLVNVDLQGDINALNYKAGKGILYGAGIADQYDMDGIDLSETLDWYTKSNGKDLYGWSANFNNRVKFRLAHTADGDVTQKNYDGITKANIGNEFYYRYSFDFWGCLLQLCALCILFLALCYKNIRIAYELVVGRIMAYLFAADIGGGEKLKNTLLFVRDTYITMCVCVLSVKLYEILVGAITSFGLTGLGKGLVSLFIAYAVIDGPNLVERILGMDAGLSSSVGRAMAIFGAGKAAGRTAARLGGKAVRGVKIPLWQRPPALPSGSVRRKAPPASNSARRCIRNSKAKNPILLHGSRPHRSSRRSSNRLGQSSKHPQAGRKVQHLPPHRPEPLRLWMQSSRRFIHSPLILWMMYLLKNSNRPVGYRIRLSPLP